MTFSNTDMIFLLRSKRKKTFQFQSFPIQNHQTHIRKKTLSWMFINKLPRKKKKKKSEHSTFSITYFLFLSNSLERFKTLS